MMSFNVKLKHQHFKYLDNIPVVKKKMEVFALSIEGNKVHKLLRGCSPYPLVLKL